MRYYKLCSGCDMCADLGGIEAVLWGAEGDGSERWVTW